MLTNIAVTYTDSQKKEQAQKLAQHLRCPFIDEDVQDYSFLLVYTQQRLELHYQEKSFNPIYVDFLSGKMAHRHRYGGGRGQLIARAVGLQKHKTISVLDVTAGLGGDAFVLAALGAKVTLLERSPVVAALLQDGLNRACDHDWFSQLGLHLIETDAKTYFSRLTEDRHPDVIYLDPMFPESKKTALVKKEMRVLRELVGDDVDAALLLKLALQFAKKRVVVKRPRLASVIGDVEPDLVYKGKSSRYDVYTK